MPANKDALPWSERHRPRHLGQVIGNTDKVRKLAEWLRDWDEVVLQGKTKQLPEKEAWMKFQQQENINARAALISGPPGIGKTTTSALVARSNRKYTLMEFNASDARSKAIVDRMNNSLAGNHTLKFGSKTGSSIERAVIIMDECDGMAGGGDSGGMQALINMIKTTKNPIICICNDRSDTQVRNLAEHCYDIRFKRPENVAVAKRVRTILESMGNKVELSAIEAVVESCGQDIRQIINQVQFFGAMAIHGKGGEKDAQVMLSPFDACAKLLNGADVGGQALDFKKRMDMFFIDTDLMPLMLQENYLKTRPPRGSRISEDDWLQKCADASELIATADTMRDNWEVMGSTGVIGFIYPAFLTASSDMEKLSFPAWLQKRAPTLKAGRLAHEMHSRMKAFTTCSCKDLVTSGYHDVLYQRLLKPLAIGAPKDGAAALAAYGLSREFFTDQSPALRQPLLLEDGYRRVEGKVKTQLLYELQNLAQSAAAQVVKRKRAADDENAPRRKRGAGEGGGADGEEEGQQSGPEDHDEDARGLVKQKVTTKAASKAKSRGTGSAGGANEKSSLKSWIPPKEKKQVSTGDNTDQVMQGDPVKKPLLVLRFIEGHTNAVRRKVHHKELMTPWLLF